MQPTAPSSSIARDRWEQLVDAWADIWVLYTDIEDRGASLVRMRARRTARAMAAASLARRAVAQDAADSAIDVLMLRLSMLAARNQMPPKQRISLADVHQAAVTARCPTRRVHAAAAPPQAADDRWWVP